MNKLVALPVRLAFSLIGLCCTVYGQETSMLHKVNPFIGTTKSDVLTRWGGNGGIYPGAVAPSGAIQLSPETRTTGAKGYDYADKSIYYFTCTGHYSGFPEGSAGHFRIMPVSTEKHFKPGFTNRPFSHAGESAAPGYYKVTLQDDRTVIEATADTHTGMFKFTFPGAADPWLFVGDAGTLSFPAKNTLHGTMANAVVNFSKEIIEKRKVEGGYLLKFKGTGMPRQTLILKISISTVDAAAAQNNINQEIGKLDFQQLRARTGNNWSKLLNRVEINDPQFNNKTVFYTALYHSLLIPWVISDVDGRYRGVDNKLYHAERKHEYGGFSPWDTFRSLHPLLTLLYPEKQEDVIRSMLHIYQQSGHLPTETMTGNHAVAIITDAYLKGIDHYDQQLAYRAMKSNLMDTPFVQRDMDIYHQQGYIPFSYGESVTRTVEYAYNDWALGVFAREVMKNEQDARLLAARGFNYRNVFSPESLFMLPRKDREFKSEPGMTGYKEGNKWIYSYFVPHNAKDLINLMGGDEAFTQRLDSALNREVILYDNETVFHLPYLFNAAGSPSLTQKWVKDITLKRFANTPGGLPGNDDLGSMSSAYIFNALGFFSANPGIPFYAIGSPLFKEVKLHLAGNKILTIRSAFSSPENKYIKSVRFNQKPYEQLVIAHQSLQQGGTLDFVMNSTPVVTWPKDKDPLVLSATKEASAIRVVDYAVHQQKVVPDAEFQVSFRLHNSGSLGTKKVTVYVNGQVYASKHVLVPPGVTVTDSISCRLYEPGKILLDVNNAGPIAIEVILPDEAPANPYRLSALKVIPVLPVNAMQKLSYTVQNVTGTKQEFHVPVKTSGGWGTVDTVFLNPGEKKTVLHQFKADQAGVGICHAAAEKVLYKAYDSPLSSLLLDLSLIKTDSGDTVADHSGLKNNGLFIQTHSSSESSVQLTGGKPVLLGEQTYAEVASSASLDHMGTTLSMMFWVYPEAEEKGLVDLLSKGDHHVIQTSDNKTLTFFAGGWGRGDVTVSLPKDWKRQWHHIAGVCKDDLLSVYIDGLLVGTAKVDGTVDLSVDSKWQVGRNEEFPSERIFHGYIDQVKVYREALLSNEIMELFNRDKKMFK